MRSTTTLDYVTLAGTVFGNKLRRHSLEAMTLRWETQVGGLTSNTKIEYWTLSGTVIGIKLRPLRLDAMRLLWHPQVHWLDFMFTHRLRESRRYCNRNPFETSSTQCDHASLGNTCALSAHDPMLVLEIRGDDVLVAVSVGDRHGR